MSFSDIDECSRGTDNCDHTCTNTDGSYTCGCNTGYFLESDGHSCQCGGRLNTSSGSFQTEGWPNSYLRENFQCEWLIEVPLNGATIQFTIDESAFGINGRPPCSNDHIEFFDGTDSDADSLEKICGLAQAKFYPNGLPVITTTSSSARVVFTGSSSGRSSSRVGVKVDYITIPPPSKHKLIRFCSIYGHILSVVDCGIDNGGCDHICVQLTGSVECQCETGYDLVDRYTCTGKWH